MALFKVIFFVIYFITRDNSILKEEYVNYEKYNATKCYLPIVSVKVMSSSRVPYTS